MGCNSHKHIIQWAIFRCSIKDSSQNNWQISNKYTKYIWGRWTRTYNHISHMACKWGWSMLILTTYDTWDDPPSIAILPSPFSFHEAPITTSFSNLCEGLGPVLWRRYCFRALIQEWWRWTYCWWFVRNPAVSTSWGLVVEIPSFIGVYTFKRWLGMGFLNHQQYLGHFFPP